MIKLGVKAKDIVTGFIGIVTGRYSYLTWCDRYQLTPEARDWKCEDSCTFDENSIEVIEEWVSKRFEQEVNKKVKTGWPEVYKSKIWY